MKKLFTLLMIGIIMIMGTQTTMAATKKKSTTVVDSSKYVTNSNLEKLVDKYGPEVKKFINTNTKSIKDGSLYVYKIYVKEEVNEGYGGLFTMIISFIVMIVFFVVAFISDENDNEIFTTLFIVLGIIIGIVFVVSMVFFVAQGYYQIINPQYYAIQDLISNVTSIVHP